ncbi:GAF domain-containing protein [Rhodopirellula sp. JC639]|uniref:GAF domain-containing protein n=1 Tax=Stieleria mannarensis TaxID=2755585 RepID=UPI001603B764
MTSSPEDCGEEWGEIEQFVAEVSELSQSASSLQEFAAEALDRTVELLAADGGTVWMVDDDREFQPLCHAGTDDGLTAESRSRSEHHTRLRQTITESGQPQSAAIPALRTGDSSNRSSSASAFYFCTGAPLRVDREVIGVIEVVQSTPQSDAARIGSERLLAIVGDLAGDFLRRQQLKDLRASVERWRQYEALCQRAHASLDVRDTAFQLVNDGRWFIGCDRASLLIPKGGQLVAVAISGVDTLDRRSDLVRLMESLAQAVAPSQQWLRYRGQKDPLPPQLEQPLSEFVDQSHSQSIDVVPLLAPSVATSAEPSDASESLVGMLVLEKFDATIDAAWEERVTRIANLCSSAFRNANDYESLPLLALARWIRRSIGYGELQRRKLTIGGIAAVLVIVALQLIPATHYVEAEGEAQPVIRRNIYAAADGEVVEVLGDHDASVAADQVVVVLRSRELDLESERLQGEYQTIEKRLLAIASARVQSVADNAPGRFPGQLAAEEQELKQQLASLQTQIALVRKQQQQLRARSPIDGRILTWNPQERLSDRPVQRGQLLVSVADLGGPWELELSVSDRGIGHVVTAQNKRDDPLEVSFTLATGGSPTYRGSVKQIAGRTEVLDGQQASTRVLVSVPADAVQMLRPGVSIKAKFDCGTQSLGYVWFHEIYETVRGWILF